MNNTESALAKLAATRADINQALEAYLETDEARFCLQKTNHSKDAYEKLREFSMRPGKRIRGALTLIAYEGFGGTNKAAGLQAAVAIELVQNYLLIIDDVMDKSQMRRGSTSVHEQYFSSISDVRSIESAKHLSSMLGINVGLATQHIAAGLMARIDEDPQNVLHAHTLFHQNILATCYGQIEDLFNDAADTGSVLEGDVSRVHELKNSFYTFINPLQVGAALAGAEEQEHAAIEAFGIPAGIAFQLRDDIIGLFGVSAKTGKSSLDDIREGKMTLLIVKALSECSEAQKKQLLSTLGDEQLTEAAADTVRDIVRQTGALSYVELQAKKYSEQAQLAIEQSNWPQDMQQTLSGLMTYIIEREG